MDSLYLLLPLSVLLVLALIGLFAWALHGGQFDDLEREGWRVLEGMESLPLEEARPVPEGDSAELDPAQAQQPRSRENKSDER
jgi:cbb3-type cytochrome oxidase maturation protein